MKKIIAFAIGTVALIGVAVGVQASTSGAEENKSRPPAVSTAEPSAAPSDGTTKEEDGTREGSTEDHTDKPGENK